MNQRILDDYFKIGRVIKEAYNTPNEEDITNLFEDDLNELKEIKDKYKLISRLRGGPKKYKLNLDVIMVESTIRNYFSLGEIMLNLTTEKENAIEQNQLRLFIHMYGEFALRIINNFPFSNQKYDSIEHYFDDLTFNGNINSMNEGALVSKVLNSLNNGIQDIKLIKKSEIYNKEDTTFFSWLESYLEFGNEVLTYSPEKKELLSTLQKQLAPL